MRPPFPAEVTHVIRRFFSPENDPEASFWRALEALRGAKWGRSFPPKGAKYTKTATLSSSYGMTHVRKTKLGGTIKRNKCANTAHKRCSTELSGDRRGQENMYKRTGDSSKKSRSHGQCRATLPASGRVQLPRPDGLSSRPTDGCQGDNGNGQRVSYRWAGIHCRNRWRSRCGPVVRTRCGTVPSRTIKKSGPQYQVTGKFLYLL